MPEAPLESRAGLPVAGHATAATAACLHGLLSTYAFYLPPFCMPLGTLLLFLGDLLHCVLHPPPPPLASAPTEAAPRRTLLVNIWPCRPRGAAHIPLPPLTTRPSSQPQHSPPRSPISLFA